MHIRLNNEIIEIPRDDMNVRELLDWRNIPAQGTAVALNGVISNRTKWDNIYLKENDDVVIISAAFGG